MRKSREELGRIHKEKCKELKKIRAQIAADLGIDLKQSECTYEGYCSGTCPKCKSEEMKLNLAIMKQQMESADVKRKVATAGLTTAAALTLSGCNVLNPPTQEPIERLSYPASIGSEVVEGDIEYIEESEESTDCALSKEVETSTEESTEETVEGRLDVSGPEIEGKIVVPEPETEWELSGDIAILEESTEEEVNE